MENKALIRAALDAAKYAYSPYSGCKVGAALLGKSGRIFTGCNVENASYSATNCAERTAVFKAISEGEAAFLKIAVVGGKNGEFTEYFSPCGVCRQVLSEFCDGDFEVILAKSTEDYKVLRLGELLPEGFSAKLL